MVVWSRAAIALDTLTTVTVASGSVVMVKRVPGCSGTSKRGRGLGDVGAAMGAKCFLIRASTVALSKSPTATTAIRSGRYQSL